MLLEIARGQASPCSLTFGQYACAQVMAVPFFSWARGFVFLDNSAISVLKAVPLSAVNGVAKALCRLGVWVVKVSLTRLREEMGSNTQGCRDHPEH